MSKAAPLNRLRDITRQRSIRRPLLIPVPVEGVDGDVSARRAEWPIPS
jgi:hypothetical protein